MGGKLPNIVLTGCSTDSNNRSGFKADAGGEHGPILLSGWADAGISAPGPVSSKEANDEHGAVMFGTGRNPGAGQQCTVTFSVPFAGTPAVTITSQNEATARLEPYVSATAYGFSIMTANAPAAAQDNSTCSVAWITRG